MNVYFTDKDMTKKIDDLRRAIAKGWDGKSSDKTVSDIIKITQSPIVPSGAIKKITFTIHPCPI